MLFYFCSKSYLNNFFKRARSDHDKSKMTSKNYFGPPLNLGRDLFGGDSDEEDQSNNQNNEPNLEDVLAESEEKLYEFPNNISIKIREFAFHLSNANFVWKGNVKFADWICRTREKLFDNKKIVEIASGMYYRLYIEFIKPDELEKKKKNTTRSNFKFYLAGTGILSIFMKLINLNVTSSDYDDHGIIQKNIAYNAALNGVEFPHVPHTWGTEFPHGTLTIGATTYYINSNTHLLYII